NAGDDVFQWDPGDGSDTVEGGTGNDRMVFNGANLAENFEVSANGDRVLFTRNIGNITMDLNDIETIDLKALGGTDAVVVNDTTGTDLATVNVDLASPADSGTGDGQVDSVAINATNGDDIIHVASSAGGTIISVTGLSAQVNITGAEAANDVLTVNALNGNDVVDASSLPANLIGLALNGGAGIDHLVGSQGADTVSGGQGDDTALMGAGDDGFVWDPGGGNDIVGGPAGDDRAPVKGANMPGVITISANGGRVLFTRNIGSIVMDVNDVETVDFNARGGADLITVNDLSGTDLTTVNLDLGNPPASGTGDGAADSVVVNGTDSDD